MILKNKKGISLIQLTVGIALSGFAVATISSVLAQTLKELSQLEKEKMALYSTADLRRAFRKDFLAAFTPKGGEPFAPFAAISKSGISTLAATPFVPLTQPESSLLSTSAFPQLTRPEALDECPGVRIITQNKETGIFEQVSYFTACVPSRGVTKDQVLCGNNEMVVVRVERIRNLSTPHPTKTVTDFSPTEFNTALCAHFEVKDGYLDSVSVTDRIEVGKRRFTRLTQYIPGVVPNLDFD